MAESDAVRETARWARQAASDAAALRRPDVPPTERAQAEQEKLRAIRAFHRACDEARCRR